MVHGHHSAYPSRQLGSHLLPGKASLGYSSSASALCTAKYRHTSNVIAHVGAVLLGLFLLPGATSHAQACIAPPENAVAWWPFDETGGTVANDVVSNHAGLYFGSPIPTPGQVEGSLRFDGSSFVGVPDTDLWAFGTHDFTIELWANFDRVIIGSVGHPGAIFIGSDDGPGTRNKWFFAYGGGFLNFHINGPAVGSRFFPLVPFSPNVGQWYHLAIVRRGSTWTIFVDGLPGGSATDDRAVPNASVSMTIGQAENLGFFTGRLDEITIYDRALSQVTLQAIVAAGSHGKCKAVSPGKGGNTGAVTVSVYEPDADFVEGTNVRLSRLGEADIEAQDIVAVGGETVIATFNLVGAMPGLWDVVIATPDTAPLRLAESFEIVDGGTGHVVVDLVGPGAVRVGREATFTALVRNEGLVDIANAFVQVAALQPSITNGFTLSQPALGQAAALIPLLPPASGGMSPGATVQVPIQIPVTLPLPVTFPLQDCGLVTAQVTTPRIEDLDCETLSALISQAKSERDMAEIELTRIEDDLNRLGCRFMEVKTPECKRLYRRKGELELRIRNLTEMLGTLCGAFRARGCDGDDCAGIEFSANLPQSYSFVGGSGASDEQEVCPVSSWDPNDKVGVAGAGAARYVSGSWPLTYTVFFENLAEATAPAQEVWIMDQLDAQLDYASVSLGQIRFGTTVVAVPAGSLDFSTTVDLRPEQELLVVIEGTLDQSGQLVWHFLSLDPATGQPPADPFVGFLPPNVAPPMGEGSVSFDVKPITEVLTGAIIRNEADIVFDTNPSIVTPTWRNAIDKSRPVSAVTPLNDIQFSADFAVSWYGRDEGAGVKDYTVLASENGGPFNIWIRDTADTTAIFHAEDGQCYGFSVIARDGAGNVEVEATSVTATCVAVDSLAPSVTVSASPTRLLPQDGQMVKVSVSGSLEDLGSGLSSGVFWVTDEYNMVEPQGVIPLARGSYSFEIQLQAIRNSDDQDGRRYVITVQAQDNAGNIGEASTAVIVPGTQKAR